MLKVIRVIRGWPRDKVSFLALEHCFVHTECMIGGRKIFMNHGDVVTTKKSKGEFRVGDEISLDEIISQNNWHNFKWRWND